MAQKIVMMKTPGPTDFRVRTARQGDAAAIALLAGQLGYPSSPAQIQRRLARILRDSQHAAYVAVDAQGQVGGWIHAFVYRLVESDVQAEIGGLVVSRDFRGRGLGNLLMDRAERWARSKGLKSVYLRSNVIRENAHAFYRKRGYQVIKTQHAFLKTF